MINLDELKYLTLNVYNKRKSNGANLNAHLKHCATEIVEAAKAECEYENSIIQRDLGLSDNTRVDLKKNELASELSDIIICALNCAAEYDIEIEAAIRKVIEKNQKRALGKGDKK